MKPKVYKKKPVEVETIRWFANNNEEDLKDIIMFMSNNKLSDFIETSENTMETDGFIIKRRQEPLVPGYNIWIKTLEGIMQVRPGDYIIRGIAGEFYPCKPDIFKETYEVEKVEEKIDGLVQ